GQARADDDAVAGRAEFGLHLHVMAIRRAEGKLKYAAGTESGAGAWSNDVLPEKAAQMLRSATPRRPADPGSTPADSGATTDGRIRPADSAATTDGRMKSRGGHPVGST